MERFQSMLQNVDIDNDLILGCGSLGNTTNQEQMGSYETKRHLRNQGRQSIEQENTLQNKKKSLPKSNKALISRIYKEIKENIQTNKQPHQIQAIDKNRQFLKNKYS